MSVKSKRINALLWIAQSLLAALFLFAGGFKLVADGGALSQGPIHLPLGFLRFIGLAESLGALGLVLPGIFRIERRLTPLAAYGLVIIMAGAVMLSLAGIGAGAAVVPFVVGMTALSVARGRSDWIGARVTRLAPVDSPLAASTR